MAITGYSGSCTVGGSLVTAAKAWSLDVTQETADTTNFSSNGWKESTATLKSWSGSITVIFDGGDDAGQAALIAGVTSGAAVALVLSTDASGLGTSEKFSGNAIVTSMPITNDVNGIIEVSFAFEGTGALTQEALA